VPPDDLAAVERAIRPETKVIYVETLGNPTLVVADIPALAALAHDRGIKLVVDNTFTPMIVSPARLGADVVVYSMTKYINGASDLIAGCICCTREFGHSLYDLHTGRVMLLGPTLDPRAAFDIMQRLPHLGIRMREHSRRAQVIAERLEQEGVAVIFPGLPSHPGHERFKSIANAGYGFGGMIAVDCGTAERANALLAVLQNEEQFGLIAVSLGYYDTLMSCSGSSTSSEIPTRNSRRSGSRPACCAYPSDTPPAFPRCVFRKPCRHMVGPARTAKRGFFKRPAVRPQCGVIRVGGPTLEPGHPNVPQAFHLFKVPDDRQRAQTPKRERMARSRRG
jgi:methionine-gamma-lyase